MAIQTVFLYSLDFATLYVKDQALREDFGDGGSHVIDIAAVQGCNANASAADGIDSVFVAQAVYLLSRQAGVREHATLAQYEIEILRHAVRLEFFDQLHAHGTDAFAHGGELIGPQGVELGRVQHRRDDRAAVRRRVGIVGADDALELAEYATAFFFAGRDQRQCAYPFAVKRKGLRKGRADEHGQIVLREQADDRRVFFKTVAKALVGDVQEGHKIACLDDFDDLLPLGKGGIDACGVVAAGMQDDNGLLGQCL